MVSAGSMLDLVTAGSASTISFCRLIANLPRSLFIVYPVRQG